MHTEGDQSTICRDQMEGSVACKSREMYNPPRSHPGISRMNILCIICPEGSVSRKLYCHSMRDPRWSNSNRCYFWLCENSNECLLCERPFLSGTVTPIRPTSSFMPHEAHAVSVIRVDMIVYQASLGLITCNDRSGTLRSVPLAWSFSQFTQADHTSTQ